MAKADLAELFLSLLASTRPQQVADLLANLGDSPEIGLDEEIGSSGLVWHPVGDDPGNLSAINLATKPGRSLTERVTNAIDALLEQRARRAPLPLPRNPRDAVQTWFGRPVSGADSGLFAWDYATGHYDKRIHVTLLESGREEAPTIDVLDAGVGIAHEDFPKTILSLRGGNKISKFYLVGAFGQGGSSTLAFSDFAIYASRHVDDPETVAFTVIRVLRLSDAYKEDCYVYLALKSPTLGLADVPALSIENAAIDLYEAPEVKAPKWEHGTLVRHVGFKLPGLDATLNPAPGNLYHYLHATLFDPLLPFRLIDLRRRDNAKNELVSGSRNRLMRYTRRNAEEEEEGSTELRHYRPMEFIVPHGETDPSIGIEYWVALNWRKPPKGSQAERILRSSSNELFVQRNYPIVGTMNGQNQGELPGSFFRRLNLPMVGRHIVVHIDASRAPSHVRRVLYSSTREGFKEGPVLSAIERVLTTMVSEDETLKSLERELAQRLVEKENQKTEDEVKQQITRLLLDSGVSVQEEGATAASGTNGAAPVPKKKRQIYKKRDPLQTLPYPEVSRWQMVVPADEMEIRIGDYETVLVETDADAEFDRRGSVAIRTEPSLLEVGSKSPLSGGRVRWRMRVAENSPVGARGMVIATITKPDGAQLTSSRPFVIAARIPEPAKRARGLVPPFEVLPIDPTRDDHREQWGQLWPDLADETDEAKLASVAYRVTAAGEKRIVYFNTLFSPFRTQENAFLVKGAALAELFRVQYKVWIGYHALLQEADSADERAATEEEFVERVLEEETVRVAKMQAKQAAQFVELKRAALRAEEVAV